MDYFFEFDFWNFEYIYIYVCVRVFYTSKKIERLIYGSSNRFEYRQVSNFCR